MAVHAGLGAAGCVRAGDAGVGVPDGAGAGAVWARAETAARKAKSDMIFFITDPWINQRVSGPFLYGDLPDSYRYRDEKWRSNCVPMVIGLERQRACGAGRSDEEDYAAEAAALRPAIM